MKTRQCLLGPSLLAPSFAAAPRKLGFDCQQIKDESINEALSSPTNFDDILPPTHTHTLQALRWGEGRGDHPYVALVQDPMLFKIIE